MSNRYSFYQLHMACQQRLLASLYTEQEDPDAFNAGYVEAVTPRHVLLWSVTPWGQHDGWLLRRTEDILQVYMGDDYEIRLQMLVEIEGESYAPLLETPLAAKEDLLRRVLLQAQARGEIISVMTAEDTFTGTVVQVDDLRATLDLLDFFGEPDVRTQFALRDIQLVGYDTSEERMFKKLVENRPKLI